MSEPRTASTRVRSVRPETTARGGKWNRSPTKHVPAGVIHAYVPGAAQTACGRHLAGLRRWPGMLFRQGFHRKRCRDCLDAL